MPASPPRCRERPKADIAILETDERVVADMIRLGRPEVLVLLNFSRDQLDRHHEIKALGRSWRNALADAGADGPVVVANADEPLIVWAAQTARQVVWVDTATTWTQDASLCPKCGSTLAREQPTQPARRLAERVAHGWYCTGCDLAQPKGDYRVVEDGKIIDQHGSRCWDPELNVPGAFNISNAACALAAAELMGVDPGTALVGMRTVTAPAGRFATATIRRHHRPAAAGQEPRRLGGGAAAGPDVDGGAGHRLRRRGRPGRVLALGRRVRAAGRPHGDRHRTARPGSRRPAGLRRGRAPLHS